MFSWELIQVRRDSTLIGILAGREATVSLDWAFSFDRLQKPAIHRIMRVSGLPFGEARTQMAYECLNGGFSYLFMLDTDICDYPDDTLMCLIGRRLPIVSALYHQRFPTWDGMEARYLPVMFNEGRDERGNPTRINIVDFQYGQVLEVAYVPSGCLLVHRSVFEAMLAAGIRRLFEWTLTVENPQGKSEDFEFVARARSLGFKAYVDTGIQVIHEAEAKVGPRGLHVKL